MQVYFVELNINLNLIDQWKWADENILNKKLVSFYSVSASQISSNTAAFWKNSSFILSCSVYILFTLFIV